MGLKQIIKHGLEHVAAQFGPHRWPSRTPRIWILMYHRVLPANSLEMQDVEPGMVVTPETLDMHLSTLKKWATPVDLAEWCERKNKGLPLPQRAVAITFDDGWLDNYQYAWPIIQKHQFPATIFLVTDWIATSNSFWPERLARLIRKSIESGIYPLQHDSFEWLSPALKQIGFPEAPKQGPDREQLSKLFAFCKHWPDLEIINRIAETELPLGISAPSEPVLLNWEQVRQMRESGLVSFGSHTCRHVRLNDNIEHNLAEYEITQSKNTLSESLGEPVSLFCYPNGDYNFASLTATKANYAGAVTTKRGYNSINSDMHQLLRVGVHNDVSFTPTKLMAKISCLL